MKIKSTYLITITSLLLFSCGDKVEREETKKAVTETKKKGNYISQKWKSTKEFFIDSDSLITAKKTAYFANQRKKYTEYIYVQNWFESNPKELLGLKGDYYKMIKATIEEDGTISYKNLIPLSEQGTFKYLFVNDDAYYIYTFSFLNKKIKPEGVRRIKKGYGDQPIHDLKFDRNNFLEEEKFQGNVDQKLFTKNGHLFFEIEKEIDDKKVIHTIDLGTERKF